MTKSITANVPARKMSWGGKTKVFAAYSRTFTQDDAGRWSEPEIGNMYEAEVIEVCQQASNWTAIRAEHFQMHGFHA